MLVLAPDGKGIAGIRCAALTIVAAASVLRRHSMEPAGFSRFLSGNRNIYQIAPRPNFWKEARGCRVVDRFVAKLRSRQALSEEDENLLRQAGWSQRRYARHEVMVRAGERLDHCHLLLSGFAARSQEDSAGNRQIVGISIAGDLLDIHGVVLGRMEQELVALSACDVASIPHGEVRGLILSSVGLLRTFTLQGAIDHAIQAAWIQALGSKRGTAKIAHLFCEMQLRLGVVGLATQMGFPMPMSQQELADYAGMTHVHLNRCLKELREAGLLTFASGWAKVTDWEGLKRLARFDEAYLNLRLIEV